MTRFEDLVPAVWSFTVHTTITAPATTQKTIKTRPGQFIKGRLLVCTQGPMPRSGAAFPEAIKNGADLFFPLTPCFVSR